MSHRPHGDVHDFGLADDCLECAEIADRPFANADARLLRSLVELAVAMPREIPPSETQAIAVKNVLDTLERAGRIGAEDPDLLERYLRERWHLRVRIEGRA